MYDLVKEKPNGAHVDIDLRQELNSLKSEFSFNVLYIRNCKYVKCDCYDHLHKTGNPDCPKCFGSGYFASIEKIETIGSSLGGYTGADKLSKKPMGVIEQKEEVYYFDYKILPKPRDFILKVTWKNGIPIDVVDVFEINNTYETRGDHGRVELFGAQVEKRVDLQIKFNRLIKELPSRALQVLAQGGKYVWPYKLLLQRNEEN